MKKLLFVLMILMVPTQVWGTTYYVDSTAGSDANNGTSDSTPWKTISKVNDFGEAIDTPADHFHDGDVIKFKRGSTWGYINPVGYCTGAGAPSPCCTGLNAADADNKGCDECLGHPVGRGSGGAFVDWGMVNGLTFEDYGTGAKPRFDGNFKTPIFIRNKRDYDCTASGVPHTCCTAVGEGTCDETTLLSNLTIKNIDISGQDRNYVTGGYSGKDYNIFVQGVDGVTYDGIEGDGHLDNVYCAGASSLTGTSVTFTFNSTAVTGIGTSFSTEIAADDWVMLTADGYWAQVSSVTNDTALVLKSVYAYTGGTGPGQVITMCGKGAVECYYCLGPIEVKNCTLYNWGEHPIATLKGNDTCGILVAYTRGGATTIHDNTVHDITGDCAGSHALDTAVSYSAKYYDNTFYNAGENCLDFKSEYNVEVYNNQLYREDSWTGLGGSGSSGALVTIHNNMEATGIYEEYGTRIHDNVITQNDTPGMTMGCGLSGTALTGTVTFSTGSSAVTGSGTAFLTEVAVDDTISLNTDAKWYRVTAVPDNTHITLSRNYVDPGGAGASKVKRQLHHVYVYNNQFLSYADAIEEAIDVGDAVGVQIYRNYFEGIPGTIVISNPTYATEIYYNVIANPKRQTGDDAYNAIYENNRGDPSYIYNNTLVNYSGDAKYLIYIACSAGSLIKNNIGLNVYGTEPVYWDYGNYSAAGCIAPTVTYNDWYHSGTTNRTHVGNPGTTYTTTDLAAWIAAGHTGDSFSDPLVLDAANGFFQLKTGSPCLDTGTPVGLTIDYGGSPIYGTADIGAYEKHGWSRF